MKLLVSIVALAAIVAMVGLGAIEPLQGSEAPDVELRVEGGNPPTIVLERGTADPEGLDRAAAEVGEGSALERGSDGWTLAATVVVEPGATLLLDDVDVRLVSEPGAVVGLEARGGTIVVRDSIVTSWDRTERRADTTVGDGRAWVLARDGAAMTIRDSTFRMLGYDAHERYGVAWRTEGTGGSIVRSTFAGNFFGIYTFAAAPMRITDSIVRNSHRYGLDLHTASDGFVIERNRFVGNGKHGMILAVRCRDAVVRGNVATGNTEHGFVVFEGSDRALLEGNEAYGNGGAGFDVSGSADTELRDNLAHENETGIVVHDRSRGAWLEGNRVAGNRVDGVRVSSGAAVAAMRGNTVDFNYRAGVYLDDGEVRIEDNDILDNVVGLWLSSSVDAASVTGNTIDGSVLDGVHVTDSVPGLTIADNRISNSGKAAFSSSASGEVDRFAATNDLRGNLEETRVRGREV